MRIQHIRIQVRVELGRVHVQGVSGSCQDGEHRAHAEQLLPGRDVLVREEVAQDGDQVGVVFEVNHVREPTNEGE